MTRRYVCTWCGANATPSDPKANAAAIQAHIRSCPKLAEHVAEAVAAHQERRHPGKEARSQAEGGGVMSASYDRIAAQLDAADAYVYRWTSHAETDAIRAEHKRRTELGEMHAEYTAELERKRRQSRIANLVAVGLVLVFLVCAAVWGF